MKAIGAVSQANALAIPRNIDGQPFDGSKDIDTGLVWLSRHPGRPVPAARIDYRRYADTAYASLPAAMDTGQGGVIYEDNGTDHPLISSGAFALPRGGSAGASFEYTHFDAGSGNLMSRIGFTVKVDPAGASTDGWAVALALANGPTLSAGGTAYRIGVHYVVNSTGWALTKVSNATGTLVFTTLTDVHGNPAIGTFNSNVIEDNMTEYTAEAWVVGSTVSIVTPDGKLVVCTDSDIATWATRYGFIELVMVARNTDPIPKFTEGWYDVNGLVLPGFGGLVTRDLLDNNLTPEITMIRGSLGNNALQIADVANAANYIGAANRIAGNPPYFYAGGSDANISPGLVGKGTGRWTDGTTPLTSQGTVGADEAAAIHASTAKATPVDADEFLVLDSAASFAPKKHTLANMKTVLSSWLATLTLAFTNKDLTGAGNTFPTFNQSTTGNAATATKWANARKVNGVALDGTADITVYPSTWGPADEGLIAWSFDYTAGYNGTGPSSTIMYVTALPIRANCTITNIVLGIATAGSGLTSGQNFAALYNSAGTLLSYTADQTTPWASAGRKSMALSTNGGAQAVTPGIYYVGILANGTTPPKFWAAVGGVYLSTNIGSSSPVRFGYDATHIPSTTAPPSTMASPTAHGEAFWVAVS